MAEDTTPTSPEEISAATEAIKEYKKVVKDVLELEEERKAEQSSFYSTLIDQYIKEKEEARDRIKELRDEIALDTAIMEQAQKRKDDITVEQKRKEIALDEARVRVLQEVIKVNKDFQDELTDFVKRQKKALSDLTKAFDNFGVSVLASAAKTVAAMKLLGMGEINLFKEAQKSIVPIDDARRDLIPFMATTGDANKLITEMGFRAERTAISITDQAHAAEQASKSFRLFSMESAETQAGIALLAAQLDDLGVSDGSAIVESFIADMGLDDTDAAQNAIKSLTMEMKELGVTPNQLFSDFNKLIGSFAMFGEAGASNIAKVSLMAQKMRTDVGTVTGFADQFSDFTGAAQAQAKINALFGMKIIDNASELVTTFYAHGQPGVALLVRRKIEEKGIDMEEFFSGPAGAARAAFAGRNLGLGTAQDARRFFMTPMSELQLEGVGEGAGGPGGFDEFATDRIPFSKQIEADAEKRATELLRLMGLQSLGQVGMVVDSLFAELSERFSESTGELAQSDIMLTVREAIAKALTGNIQKTPVTTEAPPAMATEPLSGALTGAAESSKELKISVDKLIEALEKDTRFKKESPTGGDTTGLFRPGVQPHLVLSVDSSFKKAVLKTVNDALNSIPA